MSGFGLMRRALAIRRVVVYTVFTVVMMPLQVIALLVGSRAAATIPRFYHRVCCRILGIETTVRGRLTERRPALLVSNHVSYLDIIVLSSVAPASFVAKSEVARWPYVGLLAKLQRTVFVDRRRSSTAVQRDAIQRRLEAGDVLILFPEGTSGDGNRVLPFKTALFSVAERRVGDAPLTVQPVTITYTRLDGIPLGHAFRPLLAWYGDMELGPHLWTFLGLGRVRAEVDFHPPIDMDRCGNRRAMAAAAQAAVEAGLRRALTDGRDEAAV